MWIFSISRERADGQIVHEYERACNVCEGIAKGEELVGDGAAQVHTLYTHIHITPAGHQKKWITARHFLTPVTRACGRTLNPTPTTTTQHTHLQGCGADVSRP